MHRPQTFDVTGTVALFGNLGLNWTRAEFLLRVAINVWESVRERVSSSVDERTEPWMLDSWGRLAPAGTSKGQGRRQSWWFTQLNHRNLQFCTVRPGCFLPACLASAASACQIKGCMANICSAVIQRYGVTDKWRLIQIRLNLLRNHHEATFWASLLPPPLPFFSKKEKRNLLRWLTSSGQPNSESG